MKKRRIRLLNTTALARLAGHWLAQSLGLGSDQEKTLRLGFDIVFSWTSGMVLVAIVSALLGSLVQGMCAALAAFVLRIFSAGAHCRTSGRCAVVTSAAYGAIGKASALSASRVNLAVIAVCCGLSAVLVLLRGKPRDPRDIRNARFRPVALLVILILGGVSASLVSRGPVAASVALAVSAGCAWQSFTVTEAGIRLVMAIDGVLDAAGIE